MRSILAFGALSLVTAAGVFACGDDDNGGPSGTAGRGGTAGAGGASGGTGGASGGTGGAATGGTAGVGGGTAQLPPLPTATCSGCVVLTVSNNSATLVDGATQNQAGFLFSSPATAAPWDLSAVEDQNVAGAIMMVEQSMTLVLVLVWVFVRMLTRSEEDELRRERLEEAQVPASNVDVISTGP